MSDSVDVHSLSQDAYRFISRQIVPTIGWESFSRVLENYQARRHHSPMAFVDAFPALACLAAGGTAAQTTPLTAAWILYLLGARIFDDVLDEESADFEWHHGELSRSLPAGLCSVGAANVALTHLDDAETAVALLNAFNKTLTLAAKSQSAETATPSLEIYLQTLTAKTGLVFATGAWAGARLCLHTPDDYRLQALYTCGLNTGMMVQILDDCADLPHDLLRGMLTLPVAHARAQTEHPLHLELTSLLDNGGRRDLQWAEEVSAVLRQIGSVDWSLKIAEVYQQQALQALEEIPAANKALLVKYVSRAFVTAVA